MSRHVTRMQEGISVFKILTVTRIGKRPRRSWEDNITIDLKEGRSKYEELG